MRTQSRVGNSIAKPSRAYSLALAAIAIVLSTAACAGEERVCLENHYPVKLIGSETGSRCVSVLDEPPAGYTRYPEGKVPAVVGDKWYQYWKNVIFDASGKPLDVNGNPVQK
ncbi:SCO0607 family lipoprotein [Nonomuraea spiralis]|uniref:SCO0607 family lipoprotein n=1 Tax=Nonomuraea spiralis TaxID=46182 RepID=A0ABV5IS62_9ACTN|nr:hypothetical protein [Nonomuraea spiralis]GGT45043.1 hypothetical protein GCM10010176_105510 [Nonomuraea spiralis]